ncbi:hypothetical protein [Helicobacter canis]|uniref:Uncharacterized protein n=1 Tax=Helicobacter canis TaxID=29419 RepID=A0A377JLE5_9HELI|nr:hypothetical protein [Helicobacter canis]STO96920.1 Uncharacterised protein [Helicobacter canis]STP06541.1 Uncharacterised protein [Helicobacter canis]
MFFGIFLWITKETSPNGERYPLFSKETSLCLFSKEATLCGGAVVFGSLTTNADLGLPPAMEGLGLTKS